MLVGMCADRSPLEELMASLREHQKARQLGTELSQVEICTYEDALRETHRRVVADVWPDREPSDDEYVAVVIDRLESNGGLTPAEYQRFCLLTSEVKRRLALMARP